jgi:hypothetical protein
MTKEVTTTTIKSGKIIISPEGKPEVNPMQDIIVLGTLSEAKAHKTVYKKYGAGTTIYDVQEETKTYRMKVEDFIKVAELITDETPDEDMDGEEDEDNEETDLEDKDSLPDKESRETDKSKAKRSRIKVIPKEEIVNT